jgi:hypothetical protein
MGRPAEAAGQRFLSPSCQDSLHYYLGNHRIFYLGWNKVAILLPNTPAGRRFSQCATILEFSRVAGRRPSFRSVFD